MLLEVKVIGSAEWYENVLPKLRVMGFEEKPELTWADPETDGELMGFYFDYQKEPMPISEFALLIKELDEIIQNGEAPFVEFSLVKDR